MRILSRWFYKVSTGWIALLGLVVFLVFSSLTLPGQSKAAEQYSMGLGSPDTTLIYSGNELYTMATTYGVEGRQAFLTARWTFDVAFPLVYTFFLTSAISWFLNKGLASESRWRVLNLVPLAGMILDFLENSATSIVMANYPDHVILAEFLAPAFTFIKWVLVGGSFAVLVLAAIIALVNWSYKRPGIKNPKGLAN